jgi:hypothetical protein
MELVIYPATSPIWLEIILDICSVICLVLKPSHIFLRITLVYPVVQILFKQSINLVIWTAILSVPMEITTTHKIVHV